MEIMLGYGAHGLPYLREKIKSSIMHLFGKQSILISHWGQHELEQHYFATRKNTVIPPGSGMEQGHNGRMGILWR